MKRLKKAARSLQNYLETKVLSTLEKLLWGTNIFIDQNGIKYQLIVIICPQTWSNLKIMDFEDINSVLEVGCAGTKPEIAKESITKANLMAAISTQNAYQRVIAFSVKRR